jgi:hypothetical protein
LDLFDPGFQPDVPPEVHAAREMCWYARTPLGYAVLRYDEWRPCCGIAAYGRGAQSPSRP